MCIDTPLIPYAAIPLWARLAIVLSAIYMITPRFNVRSNQDFEEYC